MFHFFLIFLVLIFDFFFLKYSSFEFLIFDFLIISHLHVFHVASKRFFNAVMAIFNTLLLHDSPHQLDCANL